MEFHGDAADLDRLFVIESPDAVHRPGTVAVDARRSEPRRYPPRAGERSRQHGRASDPRARRTGRAARGSRSGPGAVEVTTRSWSSRISRKPEKPLSSNRAGSASDPTPPRQVPPRPESARTSRQPHTAPRILIPDEMRRRLAEEAAARAAAAREFEPQESDGFLSQRWPWVAGVAVLALLFVLQVVHSKRDDLVKSSGLGPAIAGTYCVLRPDAPVPDGPLRL